MTKHDDDVEYFFPNFWETHNGGKVFLLLKRLTFSTVPDGG